MKPNPYRRHLVAYLAKAAFPGEPTKLGARAEVLAYREGLEHKPDAELVALHDAAERARPIPEQAQYLVAGIFANNQLPGHYRISPSEEEQQKRALRRKLEAMTPDQLSEYRRHILSGNSPDWFSIIEDGQFWNHPEAFEGVTEWSLEPVWMMDDAAALSLGRNPRVVSWPKLQPFSGTKSPFVAQYRQTLERLNKAAYVKDIGNPARPWEIVEWGVRWGVSFPAPLAEAVNRQREKAAANSTAHVVAPTGNPPQPGTAHPQDCAAVKEPPLPLLTTTQLARFFRCPGAKGVDAVPDPKREPHPANILLWKQKASKASQFPTLYAARLPYPKGAKDDALWHPEGVAAWLIEKTPGLDSHIAECMVNYLKSLPPEKQPFYPATLAAWMARMNDDDLDADNEEPEGGRVAG